jgi:hypothetical protein
MTTSRCKARVYKIERPYEGAVEGFKVTLGAPPYDPDPESENAQFFHATPCISMEMYVSNEIAEAAFPEGKDVWVDFTPCTDSEA